MILPMIKFAETTSSESGIGAFHINLKSFIFQLVTFLIVLMIFKRWILPPLQKTLEDRRSTLEQSLQNAKETEDKLAKAEVKVQEVLNQAREQADKALADANAQAKEVVAKAEAKAEEQAKRIVSETQERLAQEREELHDLLKVELADLVIATSEKVLSKKINEHEDRKLVENALKDLA